MDLDPIIRDFRLRAEQLGLAGWRSHLETEYLPAPHRPTSLRPGHGAVYVFALAEHDTSEAGAGRVLKVGRVGPNSNPRFQAQHYSPASARSTLANSLITYRLLWPWLGIEEIDVSTVREWMLAHLDRANIYVPAAAAESLPHLEMYVRARLGGSVYEGAA